MKVDSDKDEGGDMERLVKFISREEVDITDCCWPPCVPGVYTAELSRLTVLLFERIVHAMSMEAMIVTDTSETTLGEDRSVSPM